MKIGLNDHTRLGEKLLRVALRAGIWFPVIRTTRSGVCGVLANPAHLAGYFPARSTVLVVHSVRHPCTTQVHRPPLLIASPVENLYKRRDGHLCVGAGAEIA